ncbi:hypothetical protein [Actinomadura sp. 9N215]|uniref:hypothetical protein n=1 Tax=Actinomadura sp. 9N215 TaxID=3375150 RepID=UPI0037A956CB
MSDVQEKVREPLGKGRRALAVFIGIALTCVILAPIVLSSSDLVRWANSPDGLGMPKEFAWIVFVALDLAAASCVGMVTFAAWRGESAGAFHALTWIFATGSAYANYRHGIELKDKGKAQDAWWFFPAMSLAGPLLLDVTLARIKRWVREEQQTQMSARPRFGPRWIPGVAFRETARAWAASRRENISKPAEAIAYVRECSALSGMGEPDAIRYAWSAIRSHDEYSVRKWLAARRITISQSALDETTADRPRTPLAGLNDTGPIPILRPEPAPAIAAPVAEPTEQPEDDGHAHLRDEIETLNALTSKRDKIRHAFAVIGEYDVRKAVEWLAERGVSVDRSDAYAVRKNAQESQRSTTLRAVGSQPEGEN